MFYYSSSHPFNLAKNHPFRSLLHRDRIKKDSNPRLDKCEAKPRSHPPLFDQNMVQKNIDILGKCKYR